MDPLVTWEYCACPFPRPKPTSVPTGTRTRVAMLGDSITEFTKRLPDGTRVSMAYELQQLLGDAYQVSNFGRTYSTALMAKSAATRSIAYWTTSNNVNAIASVPNIVFVMLGFRHTNQEGRRKEPNQSE